MVDKWMAIVACDYCGVNFERYKCKLKPNRKIFCSKDCAYKGFNRPKKKQMEVNCGICGKAFFTFPCRVKIGKVKYCSKRCYGKSRLGHTPWNVGMACSDSLRNKISLATKGIKKPTLSVQMGGKTGEGTNNWQGGLTEESKRIRNSNRYLEWRGQVFERDNFTCQICEDRGGTLNAHHIKLFSEHEEHRFNIDNGICLCELCHAKLHRRMKIKKPPLRGV